MKTLIYESWVIEYDDVLTHSIYNDLIGGTKICDCQLCINFSHARDSVYPDSFRKMLDQLGIDAEKETEVFQYYRISPGWHLYGGWFHFVGTIKKAPPDELTYKQVPDESDFSWYFSSKQDLVPKAFCQNPVVQLNWIGKVPWVIDAEEPR